MAEELTTDEQAIWAAQARVSDSTAMETLLMPLPTAVAVQARELAELPGQSGMEYDERLKCAYWLTHHEHLADTLCKDLPLRYVCQGLRLFCA